VSLEEMLDEFDAMELETGEDGDGDEGGAAAAAGEGEAYEGDEEHDLDDGREADPRSTKRLALE
jgi:hypothetical protein